MVNKKAAFEFRARAVNKDVFHGETFSVCILLNIIVQDQTWSHFVRKSSFLEYSKYEIYVFGLGTKGKSNFKKNKTIM